MQKTNPEVFGQLRGIKSCFGNIGFNFGGAEPFREFPYIENDLTDFVSSSTGWK